MEGLLDDLYDFRVPARAVPIASNPASQEPKQRSPVCGVACARNHLCDQIGRLWIAHSLQDVIRGLLQLDCANPEEFAR